MGEYDQAARSAGDRQIARQMNSGQGNVKRSF
jgi:hypothetical protein